VSALGAPFTLALGPTEPGGSRAPARSRDAEPWIDRDGRLFALSSVEEDVAVVRLFDVAVFRADAGSTTVRAHPEPLVESDAIEWSFERFVRPLLVQLRGAEVLHASATLGAHGVVAFTGPSHSGKSTLAAALARRGRAQWADDAVVLSVGDAAITAHAIPFRPRLRLCERALDPCGARGSLATAHAEASLAAIAVLEPASASSILELWPLAPASAARALLAQAFSFWMGDPARKRQMVTSYLELAARVPIFTLQIPHDVSRIAEMSAQVEALLLAGLDNDRAHEDDSAAWSTRASAQTKP
jgi:hypothetical protein